MRAKEKIKNLKEERKQKHTIKEVSAMPISTSLSKDQVKRELIKSKPIRESATLKP